MSYAFPRTLSYPYPAEGPVRVGCGIAPSGLGDWATTENSIVMDGLLLMVFGVVGVVVVGTLGFPFYMGYKLVTSAKDD